MNIITRQHKLFDKKEKFINFIVLLNKKSFIYFNLFLLVLSFCFDFNLEATEVKIDKIRGLKQNN